VKVIGLNGDERLHLCSIASVHLGELRRALARCRVVNVSALR
jgi:hypothetical protein